MENLTQVSPELAQLRHLRILVVDDEVDSLFLLQFILESQGASVIAVTSVQAALNAVSSSGFDVLISDIVLPEQDGLSLIRCIRSLDQTQSDLTPAIAYSALDPACWAAVCLEAGYQSFVTKPIHPEELVAVILEVAPRRFNSKQPFHLSVDRLSRLA